MEVVTPAVFLDRDGTLIRDVGYLRRVEQMELLPRVPEAIRLLRAAGFKVVVITNQSAIGRGLLTEHELELIHAEMQKRLAQNGGGLDGVYYCPHHPIDALGRYRVLCDCRKPNTGLVARATKELELNPNVSYVVGDKPSDMELAGRIGARAFLIRSEISASRNSNIGATTVADLWEAAQCIVAALSGRASGGYK